MKTVITLLISIALLSGCNSIGLTQESKKQNYLKEFERLVLIVENREAISEKEWVTEFDPQFKQYEDQYRELETILTESEFGMIKDLRERYRSRRIRSKAANGIKNSIRDTKDFFRELFH